MKTAVARQAISIGLLVAAFSLPSNGQEATPPAEALHDAFPENKSYSPYAGRNFPTRPFPPALASLPGTPLYRSAWEKDIRAAETTNEPGRFSAFIGFEWTSNTGGNNLHRVVMFRDGGDKAGQVEPYVEATDSVRPLSEPALATLRGGAE